jgi:hypothetical protein
MIGEVIRGFIGFHGLLMGDDISMGALSGSIGKRTIAAFKAGCDVVLHCNGSLDEMQAVAGEAPVVAGEAGRRAAAALRLRQATGDFDVESVRSRFAGRRGNHWPDERTSAFEMEVAERRRRAADAGRRRGLRAARLLLALAVSRRSIRQDLDPGAGRAISHLHRGGAEAPELAADYLVMAAWLAYLKSRCAAGAGDPDGPSAEDMANALAWRLKRLRHSARCRAS